MRVSSARRAGLFVLVLAAASSAIGQGTITQAGIHPLDPAFRLPAGGVAAAGPLVDTKLFPVAAWLLSEDRSLYLLTELGKLASRIALDGEPSPFMALDPFGRVLVVLDGRRLAAYTRTGREAWSFPIEIPAGGAFLAPAFGSDGRIFLLSGRDLLCLNPAGRRLWHRRLGAAASCPPSVDGSGHPAVALVDGSLRLFSPYGGEAGLYRAAAYATVLAPVETGAGLPSLAAGLSDGSLLFLGAEGDLRAQAKPGAAAILSLFWDGALLYGLDAGGRAFAAAAGGRILWSTETGCRGGGLSPFPERLIARGQGKAVSMNYAGEIYRELTIPNGEGSPALAPGGLAFSAGKDWVLAAYRFEAPLGNPRESEFPPYAFYEGIVAEEELYDSRFRDSDRQLAALADIEKKLRSGTIGEDEPRAAAYCAALVSGELDGAYPKGRANFSANILARARAIFILGEMGSPAYREWLVQALEREKDSALQSAACDALAAIGVDPSGVTAKAFLAAAERPVDEQVAIALIEDMERMALWSGTQPGQDSVRAFLKLAAKPYGEGVQNRATTALGRIAGTVK